MFVLLAGCGQAVPQPPAGNSGPASLRLVPTDYYSRTLRAGPSRGATRAKPATAEPTQPEENKAIAPPPAPLEDMSDLLKRIETLDERVRELQKQLLQTPQARQRPISFISIDP